jgi:hypothetical protein
MGHQAHKSRSFFKRLKKAQNRNTHALLIGASPPRSSEGMLTRATKRHLSTFKRSHFSPTHATWEVVLSNDSLYAVLREWRWLWVLPQVCRAFAEAIRPFRTHIMRVMCDGRKEEPPILWRTKVRDLFGIAATAQLMARRDVLPHIPPFQDINAAFLLSSRKRKNSPSAEIARLQAEQRRMDEALDREAEADKATFEASRDQHEEEYQLQTKMDYDENELECQRDHADFEREKVKLDSEKDRPQWHAMRLEAIQRLHDKGMQRIARLAAKGEQRLAQWQAKRAESLAVALERANARNAVRRERKAYFTARLKEANEDLAAPRAASMAKTMASFAGPIAFPMIYDRVIGKRLRN